ncbi:MAG: J domain-containing protein [Clostridia bacterium]
MNYYKLLNVKTDATTAEISAAYKALARKNHPDLHRDIYEKEKAEDLMKTLNLAKEILTDPVKRKEYDLENNFNLPVTSESINDEIYEEEDEPMTDVQYEQNFRNSLISSFGIIFGVLLVCFVFLIISFITNIISKTKELPPSVPDSSISNVTPEVAKSFTLGDPLFVVTNLLGKPSLVRKSNIHTISYYGSSAVITSNDKAIVVGWKNSGNLPLTDLKNYAQDKHFSIKSNTKFVLTVMGNPDSIVPSVDSCTWNYGSSTIMFDADNLVSGWYNTGALKASFKSLDKEPKELSLNENICAVSGVIGDPLMVKKSGDNYICYYPDYELTVNTFYSIVDIRYIK